MSVAIGAAYAKKLNNDSHIVYSLHGDGELDEGQNWEAIMFAAHHRLSNLIAIVDLNGQQAFGRTEDVLDLSPMHERWRAFGWKVAEVDGHDMNAMDQACDSVRTPSPGAPQVLIAKTVFGRGASFMERQIKWHYLPMSEQDYRDALLQLTAVS